MSDLQPAAADDNVIRVGTRKSPLAMAQAHIVVAALQAALPTHRFPIDSMTTTGDRDQTTALYNFGGKGLWTTQLEDKLVADEVDVVVHSLKDMPTTLPDGLVLGCVTERHDPRDTLVIKQSLADRHGWRTLADLPPGSVVGTSSVRRIAQLARRYPHLAFRDHRGNINTRLAKLDAEDSPLAAIILAAAGLQRMDFGHRISQFLDADGAGVLHAVGQGALGVECRAGDARVLAALAKLRHEPTALACTAERSLMRALEGGCSVPIGVETAWLEGEDGSRRLRMRATVVAVKGDKAVDADETEVVASEAEADEFGKRIASDLVARGADAILDAINADKAVQAEQAEQAAQAGQPSQ
ncbi:Tetrapyrrole biosynthesis, hydroxymethylbilane synthase [Cordyceps fumosorosea ARSEF 2679]|uniref:Porphobilinogen deaminase n=1 Tax=Cordyceps fumosorosea (strain ARSEF 2679) TaxID=1081104 RepID=A0A167Q020_CORFA|nr:Tetrapyrrole biosynthesis, hydroxymethylbilane synthase [Cordyceps fumosorosea ARSEF 2679]OAA57174.1 Tetrapyrrole biosynthesis, hydroxymethylbilane synthase [Cordyceps fumosorosea ARSEF 2679]